MPQAPHIILERQFIDANTLLFHLRMDVQVERKIDGRMTQQFAYRLTVTTSLDASRGKSMA